MIPNQIEKEILIEAPIDVVWRVVTQPDQIKQWFCEEVELSLRPGARGRMTFSDGTSFHMRVEAIEPQRRFAFRWGHPDPSDADPENSMLVEFTLEPEAGSTRLRVVESGFDQIDWTDERKAKYADDHSSGWPFYLTRLRAYLVRETRTRARE